MSLPQQQIGFKQSRKLCLNVWSLTWLKPNLSLVITFIPIELWQLKVLLGFGQMNWKMLFLKKARLSELEERVLKKSMFEIELRNVADIVSCSVCCPSGGDFIKGILRGLIFSYL